MKRLNILHLRSSSGSGGGPEKTILLSGKTIDKEKFKLVIIYLKGDDDLYFTIDKRAKEKNLDFYAINEKKRVDWRAIGEINKLLKKHQIDILHCHDYKSDVLGLFLSKLHKIKLVTTVHGWIGNDIKERFYNWLDKKSLKCFDKVITVSAVGNRYLRKSGIPSDKLVTIHNAIDLEDFKKTDEIQDVRKKLDLDDKAPVIGYIGRLSREKDLNALLFVIKKVISKIKEAVFLIVGGGPERDNLTTLSKELQINSNTFFLGHRDDIKKIYKSLDVFVSTSLTEGLPNTMLEAQAMEVPVIATDVGGVGEIIDNGVNGLLYRPRDIDGIADGIHTLLTDSNISAKFAREGRRIICEKFSFDERMKKIEKVYLEVMGQGK